jgi:mannose-6-phosphate isomerase
VAEAWIVHESDVVVSGAFHGQSLKEATLELGERLLGQKVVAQGPATRFPLLIKLLDCAEWLSLQVHPNDEQAVALEGQGYYGKTEAWFVLDAAKDATLIAGVKPGTDAGKLQTAIRDGSVIETCQYHAVSAGQTIFVEPGTMHALGPGLLIYEVQQSSDLTYRVYDWGRSQTETRKLHIDKSLAVVDAAKSPQAVPEPAFADGREDILCCSRYFTLSQLSAEKAIMFFDTAGNSFHCLTVVEGSAWVKVKNHKWHLRQYETLLIPAECGAYQVIPEQKSKILKAWVD